MRSSDNTAENVAKASDFFHETPFSEMCPDLANIDRACSRLTDDQLSSTIPVLSPRDDRLVALASRLWGAMRPVADYVFSGRCKFGDEDLMFYDLDMSQRRFLLDVAENLADFWEASGDRAPADLLDQEGGKAFDQPGEDVGLDVALELMNQRKLSPVERIAGND